MTLVPRSAVTKERLADAVEIDLLFGGGDGQVSRAQLLDELDEQGELDEVRLFEEEYGDLGGEATRQIRGQLRDDFAEGVGPSTLLVDDTLLDLELRRLVVGADRYPLVVDAGRVYLAAESWRDFPVYAFLVGLNARYLHAPDTGPGMIQDAARLFERAVVYALRSYWGGEARHVGFPRDPAAWAAFPDSLVDLSREMRERLLVRREEVPARVKDADLDVIAWRPFPSDDRPGKSVLLCQCSTGDDWLAKGIHIDAWGKLIGFSVAPLKSLAFPFVPEAVREFTDFDWALLTGKAGIPFDRLRLAALIDPVEVEDELQNAMVAWIASLIPLLGIR